MQRYVPSLAQRPFDTGSCMGAKCDDSLSFAGKPLPQIEWRLGEEVLAFNEMPFMSEPAVISKKLKLPQVRREHHGANLTCLAFNSNLTDPLTETLRLSLYRKFFVPALFTVFPTSLDVSIIIMLFVFFGSLQSISKTCVNSKSLTKCMAFGTRTLWSRINF